MKCLVSLDRLEVSRKCNLRSDENIAAVAPSVVGQSMIFFNEAYFGGMI